MSPRSKISRRRLLNAARRRRDGEPADFDLLAIAARSAGEPSPPRRPWPSDDIAFLSAVLEAHQAPPSLIAGLAAVAAKLPLNTLLVERLSAALADRLRFASLGDVLRARALLLLGPTGAGKTTLAAKIAARIGETRAMLVNADTESRGGSARIEEYAAALGIPSAGAADAAALVGCITMAEGRQLVIDTPGSCSDAALGALIAAGDALPLLVLPADGDAREAAAMAQRYAVLGARTLLPTRLDLARHLGGMLAAADAAGLALPAASTTPHFAFGLRPLTPGLVARRLLAGALHGERSRLPAA
jgi:flagellar biosynthesis protein FlhF